MRRQRKTHKNKALLHKSHEIRLRILIVATLYMCQARLRAALTRIIYTCAGIYMMMRCDVAVCYSVWQCVGMYCSVLQCVAVRGRVRQCGAVWCCVVQRVAVCSVH